MNGSGSVPSRLKPSANFPRYSATATSALVRIGVARAQVEGADIRPAAEDELRASAIAETVHFSTLIEGNELPIVEAERAARGELDPDTKAKVELVNYVDALHFLDGLAEAGEIEITPDFLLAVHKRTTRGLGSDESPHFKPHHEGAWRDGTAMVVDRPTGKIMHEGSPQEEVSGRVQGLCDWITTHEGLEEFPPPVIAAVAHYAVTDIHPFADGNGRVARLLTAAVLMRLGFLRRRLFSFEKYYAENREAYYAALRSVKENTLNMKEWLEYFLRGLAEEYERVAAKIAELEAIGLGSGGPYQLNPSQERALTQIKLHGLSEFRRTDFERLGETSRSQANRDLKELIRARLIRRLGKGAAARYRPRSSEDPAPQGRRREWSDARIEEELRLLIGYKGTWPKIEDFRKAGSMALYQAIRRHGGKEFWARKVGLG